jgi:Mg/Co/Ni transporter MgtE
MPSYAGLYVVEVDIGVRSILRRLFQGALPRRWIRRLQAPVAPNSISWEFCNIIEPDPMRRLRLNITPAGLQKMHPADLAEIVEDLGPEGREAVLTALDSESAAETLSELDLDVQASILESLEAEKAAAIIEEMSPDEAADALQELEVETSAEILEEMEAGEKSELTELMEYEEHTAGGLMNTEYLALSEDATVHSAIEAMRQNPETEGVTAIYLLNKSDQLTAAVALNRLLTAAPEEPLRELAAEPLHKIHVDQDHKRVTEMFDKYNLLSLGVVDDEDRLVGVITADDVISLLRWGK